jgi:hypothetical protein
MHVLGQQFIALLIQQFETRFNYELNSPIYLVFILQNETIHFYIA